jgi:putative phage-type endonuclease
MTSPTQEWKRICEEVGRPPTEVRIEQGTKEWHQLRRGKITGSNMAAAAGLNPYKSRGAVWDIMTGRKEPPDLSGVPAVRHGSETEPLAINAYEAVSGNFGVQATGIVLDGVDGYIAASPDGFCGPLDEHERGTIYLEVKCPYGRDGSGIRLYDEVPEYYLPQVQGGMSVTRREVCHFVCYVPGLRGDNPETGEVDVVLRPEQICIWEIQAHTEYQAVLRDLLREFMGKYVVPHKRPPKLSRRPEMPYVPTKVVYRGPVDRAIRAMRVVRGRGLDWPDG